MSWQKKCIDRRSQREEYIKGVENSKRQNIVFPFFSWATTAGQGGRGVLKKNTPTLARGCRSCIFSPAISFSSYLFLIAEKRPVVLANFETKTMGRKWNRACSAYILYLLPETNETSVGRNWNSYTYTKLITIHWNDDAKRRKIFDRTAPQIVVTIAMDEIIHRTKSVTQVCTCRPQQSSRNPAW